MAEALGLAAGVLGVASFAIQLTECITKLRSFREHIKNAPDELQELIEELETLQDILKDLNHSRDDEKSHDHSLQKPLLKCKSVVKRIMAVLTPLEQSMDKRRARSAIKLVLKRERIERLLEDLDRAKMNLLLANQVSESCRQRSQFQGLQAGQALLVGHIRALQLEGKPAPASSIEGKPAPASSNDKETRLAVPSRTRRSGRVLDPRLMVFLKPENRWDDRDRLDVLSLWEGNILLEDFYRIYVNNNDHDRFRRLLGKDTYKLLFTTAALWGDCKDNDDNSYRLSGLITKAALWGTDMQPLHTDGWLSCTPFIEFLKWRCYKDADLNTAMRAWAAALEAGGVDLEKYGQGESHSYKECEEEFFGHWFYPSGSRVIAFNFGSKPADWHVWFKHPGDEHAGDFWDMIEHPERAIPGAWIETC